MIGAWLEVLAPIIFMGVGISLALSLLQLLARFVLSVDEKEKPGYMKNKNTDLSEVIGIGDDGEMIFGGDDETYS